MEIRGEVRIGPEEGALAPRLWQLEPGTRVLLAPGTYRGPLALPVSLALAAERGLGSVTIETPRGGTLSVEGAEQVDLDGLILRGPALGLGAVIKVYNPCRLRLQSCLLSGGRGEGAGGGALDVQQGHVCLDRCRILRNVALQGGGLRADGATRVEIRNSVFAHNQAEGVGGGALFVGSRATVEVTGCTFFANRAALGPAILVGSSSTTPGRLRAANCLFASREPELSVARHNLGQAELSHSVLPALPEATSLGLGPGVVARRVEVNEDEAEPWAPRFPALIEGLGDSALFRPDEPDLHGRPRRRWLGAVGG